MGFAPIYLFYRFFYNLFNFFHHWYADGSRKIFHYFVSFLEKLDKKLAIKITLRHFFEPLYRDYSVVGRILGIVLRSGKVLLGIIFYLFFSLVFAFVFLLWILTPLLILYFSVSGFYVSK